VRKLEDVNSHIGAYIKTNRARTNEVPAQIDCRRVVIMSKLMTITSVDPIRHPVNLPRDAIAKRTPAQSRMPAAAVESLRTHDPQRSQGCYRTFGITPSLNKIQVRRVPEITAITKFDSGRACIMGWRLDSKSARVVNTVQEHPLTFEILIYGPPCTLPMAIVIDDKHASGC
jgi:hypothetical protein